MTTKVTYKEYLRFVNHLNLQQLSPTQTAQQPLPVPENETTEVFIYV